MKPQVSIRRALSDPNLLGATLAGDSWQAWRVLLIAAMGEPLDEAERALFTELTGGRQQEPDKRVEEFVGVIGRRGGKSRAIATLATYIAALCEHSDSLVPGEVGVVLIIAPDQRQALIVLEYINAAFAAVPMLSALVASRTVDTLSLTTGISIEVRSASFRRLRGPSYLAVIADEAAFWYSEETANADTEILNAVRPGLATTNGLLTIISSPYARRGVVWDAWHRHFGPGGDPLILVAHGASRTFNPSLTQSVVDRALDRDPASASAEYLARFRTDIENFISREVVELCISSGVRERPPQANVRYLSFTDPSGGGSDSFTLCIAHRERQGDIVVVDCLRETKPPFSPSSVVEEYCRLLKSYGVARIHGDKYAGEWPREQFKRHGVTYETAEHTKSEYYVDLLPLLNSRRIDLLDNARLANQLISLERRSRAGKDSIDHPPGGHDDIANACAGAAFLASQKRQPMRILEVVRTWAAVPDRHGTLSAMRTLMDPGGHARPPPLPTAWPTSPAEPKLPRSPSFSASEGIPEMAPTPTYSELVRTINRGTS
jgi:hypothetical protein